MTSRGVGLASLAIRGRREALADWLESRRHLWIFAAVLFGTTLLAKIALVIATDTIPQIDYRIYMTATRAWMAGGPFYHPATITTPYQVFGSLPILYPPVALYLFAPFTLLPAFLWWAVPFGLTAFALWRLRPAPWAWPIMLLLMQSGSIPALIWHGNPVMWVLACVALATVYGWTGPLALVKPSLLPFALVGVRRRSWWIALAVMVAISLPFGAMWIDWIRVILNGRGGGGIFYSIGEMPLLLVPLVAWLARQRAAVVAISSTAVNGL